jgi:arabinose-5-phosphate isomerase
MLHPSGRLGAMLKFARDLMHDGAAMPLTRLGTCMSEALVEISAKGFGCVGVTDAHGMLVGIITDGDLRRHMRPDLLTARVEDVMTANPKVAHGEQLAAEVLELLNSSKITTVFVAEGRRPIGILHMHDLLRAGVA